MAASIAARAFVERAILADVEEILADGNYLNFKSLLLEHAQSMGQGHPRYLSISEEGPDHRKMFSIEVTIQGDRLGEGQGHSKRKPNRWPQKMRSNTLGLH